MSYIIYYITIINIILFYYIILINYTIISYTNKKCNNNRILVTASSRNHFHLLLLMVYNVFRYEKDICFNIWDLGLSKVQVKKLHYMYKLMLNINKRITFIFDTFNYSNCPPHVYLNKNVGNYAWKAIIISSTYEKYKIPLLWLDAGCFIKGSLEKVYNEIKKNIFYTIGAGSTVRGFTYIKTLAYLNVSKKIWGKTMCAGGVVGLYYPSSAVSSLLNKWVKCSLIKECIAPQNSSRSNHRQDQSVLSILLYQQNLQFKCKIPLNFSTHFDRLYFKYNNTKFKNIIKELI